MVYHSQGQIGRSTVKANGTQSSGPVNFVPEWRHHLYEPVPFTGKRPRRPETGIYKSKNKTDKIPYDKTKNLTAKPKTSRPKPNTSQQKPNTSWQKQIPTAKPKLFCFCCEVFGFAVRFLVLPWGFCFCLEVFGFAVLVGHQMALKKWNTNFFWNKTGPFQMFHCSGRSRNFKLERRTKNWSCSI